LALLWGLKQGFQKWLNLGRTARARAFTPNSVSFLPISKIFCMDLCIEVLKNTFFLFLQKKMTIGHFMKVLRFSDNILGPILVKNQGLSGV